MRCWHCEPYMGRHDAVCTAKQTLGTLEVDFEEQAQLVEDEEQFGNPHGDARRAARYFMYRIMHWRWRRVRALPSSKLGRRCT